MQNAKIIYLVLISITILYLNCSKNSTKSEIATDYQDLTEPAELGEAYVWFLGHCGFAVRTQNTFLIFDYIEDIPNPTSPAPDDPSIWAGYIEPEDICELNVHVFTTHEHGDHFDPLIFDWEENIPGIRYYFGWQASNNPDYHYLIAPRSLYANDTLEIYTINSNHSGVDEVAFLVKVDGIVIYHNGDYQGNYKDDFQYLKTFTDNIDIAFTSCVWQSQWTYYDVNTELFTQFKPESVFPMHVRIGDENEYFDPFLSIFQSVLENKQIVLTYNNRGTAYHYKNGLMSPRLIVD